MIYIWVVKNKYLGNKTCYTGLVIAEARFFIITENHIPHALGLEHLASLVILAFWRLTQEDCNELEGSLDGTVTSIE